MQKSFSIIDYIVGLFFSLSAIFVAKNLEKPEFPFLVLMLLSSATRLSNAIFFIAGIYILNKKNLGLKKLSLIIFFYFLGLLFIYYPAYNLAGGLCFLNLTNTDHLLFQRVGRFIYKQTYLVGLLGFFGLVYILIKNRKNLKIKESNLPYILIFILFEISFMRLPTEEGHMLPSLFMFFLILSQIKISKQVQIYLLISIFLSNFIYFDLIKVDVPNHAKNIEFSPGVSKGLLLEDYQERAIKGSMANYHIDNAINQVVNSWSNGGPNC